MRTRLRFAAAALVLVLATVAAAAGCSYITPPALVVTATPGSTPFTLSDSQFQAQLTAVAASPSLTQNFVGEQVSAFTGPDKNAYNPAFVTGLLNTQTTLVILVQDAAARGIVPTAEERASAEDSLKQQLAGGGTTSSGQPATPTGDGSAELAALGPFGPVLVDFVAIRDKYQTAVQPTEEELRKSFEALKDQLPQQACASHILISATSGQADPSTGQQPAATDADVAAALAKANDIEAQLAAGANFEELATTASGDPGSAAQGGSLGCQAKGSYVPEFDAAVWAQPVGEIGPPVKTQYGYHIIKVTKRGAPAFEDVKDQLVQQAGSSALQNAVEKAAKIAAVTVGTRYGSWDAAKGQIVAPAGALVPTTLPGAGLPELGGSGAGSGSSGAGAASSASAG